MSIFPWYGTAMATLQEIANVFNDDFRQLSGGLGAKVGRLLTGEYVAVFQEKLAVEFPVPDDATVLQLHSFTREAAHDLWRAAKDPDSAIAR